MDLKIGIYEHYKGKRYEVIGVARHTETADLDEFVVYRSLYRDPKFGIGALWIRPKKMFLENVVVKGVEVPRFRFIK
jgi:hypothetical protein